MPRNSDGKVVKIMDWIDEDTNNRTFTGAKLESDTRDLADMVEECLDVKGRNNMQANLNLENNNVINSADPKRQRDLIPLNFLQSYLKEGLFLEDNGSEQATGIIKLRSTLEDLNAIENAMVITFIAPFSLTSDNIKALESYEKIELKLQGGTIIKPLLRAEYEQDNTFILGIKDPRPSFEVNQRVTLEFDQSAGEQGAWRIKDYNLKGQIIAFAKDSYTPAGYIDLGYDYEGFPAMSKYNYLGGYSPKRKSQDALDEEGKPNPEYNSYARGFGEKLGVFPEHEHGGLPTYIGDFASKGRGGFDFPRSESTLGVQGLDANFVELGNKVEPLSNIIRYLQKM